MGLEHDIYVQRPGQSQFFAAPGARRSGAAPAAAEASLGCARSHLRGYQRGWRHGCIDARLEPVLAAGNVDAGNLALVTVLTLGLLPIALDLAGPTAHACARHTPLARHRGLLGRGLPGPVETRYLHLCMAIGPSRLQRGHFRSLSDERPTSDSV